MGATPVLYAGSPNFPGCGSISQAALGFVTGTLTLKPHLSLAPRFIPSAVTGTALIISGADADLRHTGVWLPFPPWSRSHSSFHPILLLRTKLHPHWGAKLETEPAVPSGMGLCKMKATQIKTEGSDGETVS